MERIDGRYRLVTELGSGGMGTVFEAVDELSGETIALKRLSPDLAAHSGAELLFKYEFRRLKGFSHPNFPAAMDIGGSSCSRKAFSGKEVPHRQPNAATAAQYLNGMSGNPC